MNTVQIKLYDIFRRDLLLSDDRAAALVSAVEEVVEQKEKEINNSIAAKEDIHRLVLQLELKIEQTKSDLSIKIEQTKAAMYYIGILQFLAILGSLIALIKFMK